MQAHQKHKWFIIKYEIYKKRFFVSLGGNKTAVIPHRHPGIFVAKGKQDALLTKNMDPGRDVYGEKRISVDVCYILYLCILALI